MFKTAISSRLMGGLRPPCVVAKRHRPKDVGVDNAEGLAMNDSLFFHESQHGFLILTLNRPDVLNTLNGAMSASSREALVNAAKNSDIDILVLHSAGRGFSSGGHLLGA